MITRIAPPETPACHTSYTDGPEAIAALERAGLEIRARAGTCGLYAFDAPLFCIPPLAVTTFDTLTKSPGALSRL